MPCSSDQTPLWAHDVSILWRHASDFFPLKPKSDGNARVNAIVRFCIYSSVLLAAYKKDLTPLLYGAGIALLATFLHIRTSGNSFHVARRIRKRSCRQPSVKNPYMNNPVVELSAAKEPCYDELDQSDTLANVDTVRDMDDILRDPIENRAFFTLPGGGGPPDFSKLSNSLKIDMDEETCHQIW